MAFATPADLLARYDYRTVGELVVDDDTQPTYASLLTNPTIEAILSDASGQIETAVMVGNRYTIEELDSLTDNSQAKLVRMTCDLAFYLISQRRPTGDQEFPLYEEAMELLGMLRKGEAVFNVFENKQAGNTEYAPYNAQVIAQQNLISQNTKYFPVPWLSQDQ